MNRRLRSRLLSSGLLLSALTFAATSSAVVVERIVAIVGDEAILLSELRQRARPNLLEIQRKVPPGPQQAAAESEVFKALLSRMVDEELEQQAADKARIVVSPQEVDNALSVIAGSQNIQVSELIKAARNESGLSEQDYREELRRQLLEGKMLELRVRGRVRPPTEEDLRSMFQTLQREERKRTPYRPAWIVLRVLPGSSEAATAERWNLARSLAVRARSGEDFAALAKQNSDDSRTRDEGGDLGMRAPAESPMAQNGSQPTLSPELETALIDLEPGQVSEPLAVAGSIVILKLIDRGPSRYKNLETSRPEILQRWQNDVLMKAKTTWLEELRRRTHVVVRL